MKAEICTGVNCNLPIRCKTPGLYGKNQPINITKYNASERSVSDLSLDHPAIHLLKSVPGAALQHVSLQIQLVLLERRSN
jgi:hypothetical protein